MSRSTTLRRIAASTLICFALALAPQTSGAKEKPPQVTKDGLELKKETKQRLVYARPGATFTQFSRVALVDCEVQFSQTWLRDYNNSQRDTSRKISSKDLDKAKTHLAAQFTKIFTDALTKGGYQVVDTSAPAAADVLVLRPALINIAVSAPDLMSAGRSATFAESSGEMTLYLELLDGGSGMALARVVDAGADPERYGQRQSSVSNKAAADRLLTSWAEELVKKLDLVRGKPVES